MAPFLSLVFFTKLLKKVIQAGDTGCFLTLVKVLKDEDRMLLQSHCHARAVTVLKNKRGENYIKDAILYLSFAITASGNLNLGMLAILGGGGMHENYRS